MYKRIVLLGMPCSGKSSVGKAIAEQLNCRFIDMDTVIEEKVHMKIEDIFSKFGEDKFRQLEELLAKKLGESEGVVISTGGGIVTRPAAIEALVNEETYSIYLKRGFYKIINTPDWVKEQRPLLKNISNKDFHNMYMQRVPLYTKYSTVIVPNETDRAEAISEIIEKVNELKKNGEIFDY